MRGWVRKWRRHSNETTKRKINHYHVELYGGKGSRERASALNGLPRRIKADVGFARLRRISFASTLQASHLYDSLSLSLSLLALLFALLSLSLSHFFFLSISTSSWWLFLVSWIRKMEYSGLALIHVSVDNWIEIRAWERASDL